MLLYTILDWKAKEWSDYFMVKPFIPVSSVTYGMYTMCIVQDGDKVLLLNRPDKRGFPGFIGPAAKWISQRA